MEYEKHVNRLVLGYLKTECKKAYNVFRKFKFPGCPKHLATRVGGQKLEDILKSYSQIQDIVLGHLEDTTYYNEYGLEFASPYYLAKQLLYLLEKRGLSSPASTADERASVCFTSGRTSRVSCSSNQRANERRASSSEDDEQLSSPKTQTHNDNHNISKSSILDKLSPSHQVEISSILQKKLLEKTDFQHILVNSINSVLNKQDTLEMLCTGNNESNCGKETEENFIKKAINRTESDPIFEEILQECLEPIGNTLEKATASMTTEPSTSNSNNKSTVEVDNNAAVTGILAMASQNQTIQCQPAQSQLQPQQFYIVNPPLVVPPLTQTVPRLTEHDIMTMPTLFINNKNEVTYAVDAPATPYNKGTTVSNINEYVRVFGATNPSPVITKPAKKLPVPLKATPTIKVEVYNRSSPIATTEKATSVLQNTVDCTTKTTAQVTTKPTPEVSKDPPKCNSGARNAGSSITPSSLIIEGRKPTPKSGSHVRNLQFPSPRKRSTGKRENLAISPSKKQKEEVAKDLFRENVTSSEKAATECEKEEEKKAPPQNDAQEAWDAHLRKNLIIEQDNTTPPNRITRRSTKRESHKRKSTEDQLKTPKRPDRKKERRKLQPIDERQQDDETKKILSPSKLLGNNTATKRTMEVEDKDAQQQLVATSNVRRNITNLLESPTTNAAASNSASLPPTEMAAETPITSMLMANLKDIAGSSFAVETPDFPLTPGGCLLEQSTVTSNYYMLNDNEQNKVTEAIVLKEERSSSVRKTDDDDEEEASQVHGCREILKDFNKNQAGKKKLELLDQKAVHWEEEEEEEEEEGDEETDSSIEEARNQTAVKMKTPKKASGKCMTTLKMKLDIDKTPAQPLRRKSPRFLSQTPSAGVVKEAKDDKTEAKPEGVRVAPTMTPSALSVKVELEKKRQRLIELQKQDTKAAPKRKSANRRRTTSRSKRKRASPKKMRNRSCSDEDNVDSQDEFFIKSGSNLHRTNVKNDSTAAEEPPQSPPPPVQSIAHEDPDNTLDKSLWDECVLEQQPDELHVVYDAKITSKKPSKSSNATSLDQKVFEFALPLADGSEQAVYLRATPCTVLFEIQPTEGASSDSESKTGDADELKPPKKRKHRTDSCNSNSSMKRRKTGSLLPNELINDRNIEKLLTKIHGPSGKS